LEAAPKRIPEPMRPLGALLLVLVFFAALMTAVSIGTSASSRDLPSVLLLRASWVVGLLMALFVGLVRHAPDRPIRAAVGLVRPPRAAWRFLVPAALVGVCLGAVAMQLVLWGYKPPTAKELQLGALMEPHGVVEQALVVVAMLIVQPVLEEAWFRGLMWPRLRASIGPWWAFVLTAALYVAIQVIYLPGLPFFALLALSTGAWAWWSGSTWVSVTCHVFFVLGRQVVWWLGFAGRSADAHPQLLSSSVLALLACVAVVGLVAGWRMYRSQPLRQETTP